MQRRELTEKLEQKKGETAAILSVLVFLSANFLVILFYGSACCGGRIAAMQLQRSRRHRTNVCVAHRVPAGVEEEQIEADATVDEDSVVRGLAVTDVAEAGGVADRREAIDSIAARAVSFVRLRHGLGYGAAALFIRRRKDCGGRSLDE